jgi:hypothetical protein
VLHAGRSRPHHRGVDAPVAAHARGGARGAAPDLSDAQRGGERRGAVGGVPPARKRRRLPAGWNSRSAISSRWRS